MTTQGLPAWMPKLSRMSRTMLAFREKTLPASQHHNREPC
jgi:hypothetical protein